MNLRLFLTLALSLFATASLAQEPEADEGQAQEIDAATISYALGLQAGKNMARQDAEVDVAAYSRGFGHALGEGEPELTDEELRATLTAYRQQQQKRIEDRLAREAKENVAAGEAFLAENGVREGVTTLESGLQYEILQEGDGETTPQKSDIVQVHYTGRLIDGTVFDSSVERGQPTAFPVDRVIPGWTEALQLMTVGSKWRVVVPHHLAYGERGAPPRIGPNAVLDFEVELLEINP